MNSKALKPVGFENYDKMIVWVNGFPSLKLLITKKMHFPENITHSQVSDGANQEWFIKRNECGLQNYSESHSLGYGIFPDFQMGRERRKDVVLPCLARNKGKEEGKMGCITLLVVLAWSVWLWQWFDCFIRHSVILLLCFIPIWPCAAAASLRRNALSRNSSSPPDLLCSRTI